MGRKIEIVLDEGAADLSGCIAAKARDAEPNAATAARVTPCRGGRWRMILQVTDRAARAFGSVAPAQRIVPSVCDVHWHQAAQYLAGEILASDAMREAAGMRPNPDRPS